MQKWWLAGAGVLGIVLAILLIPKPDTGGEIAPDLASPQTATTADDPIDAEPSAAQAGGRKSRPGFDVPSQLDKPPEEFRGPNPLAAENRARRMKPDAVTAGKASAPWQLIRRQLVVNYKDNEQAMALADEAGVLVNQLRQLRRAPDSLDYDAIETTQRELAGRIRDSEFTQDTELLGALDRLDGILEEYHQALKEAENEE